MELVFLDASFGRTWCIIVVSYLCNIWRFMNLMVFCSLVCSLGLELTICFVTMHSLNLITWKISFDWMKECFTGRKPLKFQCTSEKSYNFIWVNGNSMFFFQFKLMLPLSTISIFSFLAIILCRTLSLPTPRHLFPRYNLFLTFLPTWLSFYCSYSRTSIN